MGRLWLTLAAPGEPSSHPHHMQVHTSGRHRPPHLLRAGQVGIVLLRQAVQERKQGSLGRELGLLEGTASSLHCATRSAHRMAARSMQAAADAAQASAASGKCRAASPLTKGISRVTARQSNFWPIWRRRGGARSSRWSVCQQRGAGGTRSRIRLACIQLQQEEANPFCAVQSCSSPSRPSCRGQARLTCLLQSDRLAVLGAATG